MARFKPLTDTDRAIGRRLREVRKRYRMSQADLAHWLACDTEEIKRIELGRTALKYDRAAVIVRQFQVDPVWLATGKGSIDGENALPGPELQVDQTGRFSEVFEKNVAKVLSEALAAMPLSGTSFGKSDPEYQEAAIRGDFARSLANRLEDWISEVPYEDLEDFVQSLSDHAERLMASYPARSEVERAFRRAMMRMAKRRHAKAVETWGGKKPETTGTTESIKVDRLPVVGYPSRTDMKTRWKDHQRKLKELCEVRGVKAAIAKKLKVSRTIVSKWASGEVEPAVDFAFQLIEWIDEHGSVKPKT